MEIRLILRYYETFLFYFRKSNFNKKKYFTESEIFLAEINNDDLDASLGRANQLKKTYIVYCEERLHIIDTYRTILNSMMPVMLIIMTITLFKYKIALLFLLFVAIIMIKLSTYLNKKWSSVCWDYSTEITSINAVLNKHFDMSIDTDFDYLGEQYRFGELI
jgi:hypothetical protein